MKAPLRIHNLSKSYAGTNSLALDKLTLDVAASEVYGFLGANGAGKSTTIRLLMNFIQPTSGTATIMGNNIQRASVAAKRHVGYLSGDVALWPKATGNQIFDYLLGLHQVSDRRYLEQLIKQFEAEPEKRIDQLSKGNRQKIGIIQALMHQPEVLILDEPTSGLDPLMQEVFYQAILEAKARGSAVFMSSHNLTEVQRVCDRIGIIKHGQLIREQSVKDITAKHHVTIRVQFAHAVDAEKLATSAQSLHVMAHHGTSMTLQAKGSIQQALTELSAYNIVSLATEQEDLEEAFMEYYEADA